MLRAGQYGVRVAAGTRDFSVPQNFHTGCGGLLDVLLNVHRVISRGFSGQDVKLITPKFSVKAKNEWSYTRPPPGCIHCLDGENLFFLLTRHDIHIRECKMLSVRCTFTIQYGASERTFRPCARLTS